jgi:hypothetical protein
MCIPDEVAKKVRTFDKQGAEKPKVTSKEEAPPVEKKEEATENEKVPLIHQEKSDPPGLADWDKAAEVNTQHEHGIAKDCSMKVVREWVRVFCRGEILGYQDLAEFGKKTVDHYVSVKESSLSFVGRVKPGPRQFVRICRKSDRAALAIYWPPGKDRPEHIALGDGKPCEQEEYEEEPIRKEERDSSAKGSAPSGSKADHLTPKDVPRD